MGQTRDDIFLDSLAWIISNAEYIEPLIELEKKVWFRKRQEMGHIARACGVFDLFESLGSYIHQDDMEYVRETLGVTDDCMVQLFEESVLPGDVL